MANPAMNGLAKIIGQEALVSRLKAIVEFARIHAAPIEHMALAGPRGSGKRTIVGAIAEEFGVELRVTSAKILERKGDLSAILSALMPQSILYVEEINQLRQPLREILLPALVDFRIHLAIGQGPGARVHTLTLSHFSCICGVARQSEMPADIRNLFGLVFPLRQYSAQELGQIASLCAEESGISISPEAAAVVARASGGTPGEVAALIERLKRAGHRNIAERSVAEFLDVYGLQQHPNNSLAVGHADSLNDLSGTEFEEVISAVLQKMGFRSEITKATGDGGIDIIAVLDRPIVGGRYLIQCKRFAAGNLVGAPAVREFYGALTADKKAVKGIFITTSGFTQQAKDFAENLPLELIDAGGLRDLLAS